MIDYFTAFVLTPLENSDLEQLSKYQTELQSFGKSGYKLVQVVTPKVSESGMSGNSAEELLHIFIKE